MCNTSTYALAESAADVLGSGHDGLRPAAAASLVISQPAVSAALAGLQREVGAPLVVRNGRGRALTLAGEQLALYGRHIFAPIDEGTSRARESPTLGYRRLRIGAGARAGLGVSLASREAVDGKLPAGTLQAVASPLTPLARNCHLVTSTDRALPASAARFISFVADTSAFEVLEI